MIRFDNVTKDYDGTRAVNGLDLSVDLNSSWPP